MPAIFWFRRDLRLQDNEALNKAAEHDGGSVRPVYLLSSTDFAALEGIRQHSLVESLRSLDGDVSGALTIISESGWHAAAERLASLATSTGAKYVFATRAFDPAGIAEQNVVGLALKAQGIFLDLTGSYYAVTPGCVAKPDGSPYRVYTPFFKAWFELAHYARPLVLPPNASFHRLAHSELPTPTKRAPFKVVAGEAFARRTFERFKSRALANYHEARDRADVSGTSHLSHALAFGEIHPRTLLAQLGDSDGHNVYRKEIAWREFYADVLWHNPHTTTEYYDSKYARMRYDSGTEADTRLAAWQQGKTGFPMVDAGMRQLLATGWMHNRVRMIVASFLVKDLHIEWQHGAEWFERHLSDFDPASNAHGWQWTAGCGTDASPYFRVFNPITQGLKFDPNGDYVRKYIPELAHIDGAAVHEPWLLLDGLSGGYVAPIVDHSVEREEALARLAELKVSGA